MSFTANRRCTQGSLPQFETKPRKAARPACIIGKRRSDSMIEGALWKSHVQETKIYFGVNG
jgi:hypothetical protein